MPGISYGLLALSLQDPFYTGRSTPSRHLTVAVDESLVNKLLEILSEVKSRLESARRLTGILSKQQTLEEKDDDSPKP